MTSLQPASSTAQTKPASWPLTATVPFNLGGSVNGKYTDHTGAEFDGSGYTVVDIDGAFRTDNPSFTSVSGKSKVIEEACIGQNTGTEWLSLCQSPSFISRPLPGNPSAGYYFSTQLNASIPSDAPDNTCRETDPGDKTTGYCHAYHGAATAGIIVGEPIARWEDDNTKLIYAGAAPGAKVVAIKIGGGTGTNGPRGWPIRSVLDALNYVNTTLLARPEIGKSIVAVNISANGSSIAGDLPCGANSDGAQIDQVAGELKAKGVAVVMAAGNDAINGTGTWTCGTNVIPVGATGIASPTNPTNYTNISQRVRLFAPVGVGDYESGDLLLAPWEGRGSFYVYGTSFASPQVAGGFAVLRQKFGKNPSVDSLLNLMQTTGKPLTGQRAGLAGSAAAVLDIKAALDGNPG